MDTNKLMAYESRKANTTTVWLLFLFLGWSYGSLDKIGLQILFYITLGGFGLWALVDLHQSKNDKECYWHCRRNQREN